MKKKETTFLSRSQNSLGQKYIAKLKCKKGSSLAIEIAVTMIVILMLWALVMGVLQIFFIQQRATLVASETTRYVEIKGRVDSSSYAEFERLKEVANLEGATVVFSHNGAIPLEDEFTVTVIVPYTFGVGNIISTTKNFKIVYSGRSEVYWK